jgi:hypothetical protein
VDIDEAEEHCEQDRTDQKAAAAAAATKQNKEDRHGSSKEAANKGKNPKVLSTSFGLS